MTETKTVPLNEANLRQELACNPHATTLRCGSTQEFFVAKRILRSGEPRPLREDVDVVLDTALTGWTLS